MTFSDVFSWNDLYGATKFAVFDFRNNIWPLHVADKSIWKSHLQWEKCTIWNILTL